MSGAVEKFVQECVQESELERAKENAYIAFEDRVPFETVRKISAPLSDEELKAIYDEVNQKTKIAE